MFAARRRQNRITPLFFRYQSTSWSVVVDSVPFSLVSTESPGAVFAFGLEIVRDGEPVEAVVYRREPNGKSMFGVHQSAESAARRYSVVTPLMLQWHDEAAEEEVGVH
jgi:hypothetical protein